MQAHHSLRSAMLPTGTRQPKRYFQIWLSLCLCAVLLSSFSIAADDKIDLGAIKHVKRKQDYLLAKREKYFISMLSLALEKSEAKFTLDPVYSQAFSEFRAAEYLTEGKFDVQWLNTSKRLEQTFIPVRIPLFKGLIGWRIFIIRTADVGKFAQIRSLEQLKQFVTIQGGSWPDAQILRGNGFKVATATDLVSLSRMLEYKRGDFFPRAITEAWNEITSYDEHNFLVDTHLVLRYPAAYYFFVRKENPSLARAIEKGLNLAVDDGSFDKVFWPYFAEDISKTNLRTRLTLNIPNPILPDATPLNDPRLWFTLEGPAK